MEDERGGEEMEKVMKGMDEVLGLVKKEERDVVGGGCEGVGGGRREIRIRV